MTVIWQEDHTSACWVIKVNWPRDTVQHMCVIINPTLEECVPCMHSTFLFRANYSDREQVEFKVSVDYWKNTFCDCR